MRERLGKMSAGSDSQQTNCKLNSVDLSDQQKDSSDQNSGDLNSQQKDVNNSNLADLNNQQNAENHLNSADLSSQQKSANDSSFADKQDFGLIDLFGMLPAEVLLNMLKELSLKDLHHLCIVCKYFLSFITDPRNFNLLTRRQRMIAIGGMFEVNPAINPQDSFSHKHLNKVALFEQVESSGKKISERFFFSRVEDARAYLMQEVQGTDPKNTAALFEVSVAPKDFLGVRPSRVKVSKAQGDEEVDCWTMEHTVAIGVVLIP